MEIAPLKGPRDYRRALKEIEGLMHAKRNTPEGDHLDILITLVEAWELSITRSTCRIRSRRSNITWIRTDLRRATLFRLSAAETVCTRCSTAGVR
jgi:antitoxin component HigA of HigAB toxin-antitoxin module